LGERDIEKKLLDLPIPRFDAQNTRHHELAALGRRAHKEARDAVCAPEFQQPTSLARQRAYVRTALRETLEEIDELAKALLWPNLQG
jgi:hypothetical protein